MKKVLVAIFIFLSVTKSILAEGPDLPFKLPESCVFSELLEKVYVKGRYAGVRIKNYVTNRFISPSSNGSVSVVTIPDRSSSTEFSIKYDKDRYALFIREAGEGARYIQAYSSNYGLLLLNPKRDIFLNRFSFVPKFCSYRDVGSTQQTTVTGYIFDGYTGRMLTVLNNKNKAAYMGDDVIKETIGRPVDDYKEYLWEIESL